MYKYIDSFTWGLLQLLPTLHDLQVCGAYSKLVYLARSSPSGLVIVTLIKFDRLNLHGH